MPVGIAHLNVCVLLWSVKTSILLTFAITLHKSSDLFMINPHFSLNPQNSWISSAILRFHEDFHSEIHRFLEQSSDLAQRIYFIKSLSDLGVHSSALSERVSVQFLLSHFPLRIVMCSIESWIFLNIDHRSECRSIYICICFGSVLDFLISNLFINSSWNPSQFEVKSSDFLVNPWVNPQISWIS